MKIAVEGCCHGELDAIYKEVDTLEKRNSYKIDLLLICGDFQAVRNHRDLQCMAVPPKYRKLENFHKYYTGEKIAPVLTIIIGGNHEASNYLWELYHGGWVAPNMYYLGHAGCVQVNGLRIAGASGIWKGYSFRVGHHEHPPYDDKTLRSAYHIREYNIRRLSLLSRPEIVISHDWPQGIEHYGDTATLLTQKPFWKEDISKGIIGAPPLIGLLHTLKPTWWFSAHMHVKFIATVDHPPPPISHVVNPDEIIIDEDDEDVPSAPPPPPSNPDEITLDDEEILVAVPPPPPPTPSSTAPGLQTKFVALDKCLPKRKFMEVVDVETPEINEDQPTLSFDPEWLAITRAFASHFSTSRHQRPFPAEAVARESVAKELAWVKENIGESKSVEEVQHFVMTAPGPGSEGSEMMVQPPMYPNPQTRAFCEMLGIEDKISQPAK